MLAPSSASAAAAYTVRSGATLTFQNAAFALNLGSISAASSGTVQYSNATITNAFLFGPGTHVLMASTTNSFNAVTINPGSVVQQNGAAVFTDVTNRGQITASGGLAWTGGINDGPGVLLLSGSNDVTAWGNEGLVTILSGGLLNNHASSLTSYGGGQITINSGGTLNADADGIGAALNLQGSLLVNNGAVTGGVTNVYYGATVTGSGSFAGINNDGGTIDVTSGGSMHASSVVLNNGTIVGSGLFASPATITTATTVVPNPSQAITLAGNLSGGGQFIESGPGSVVLTGSNSYTGATTISGGTLQVGGGGSGASIGGTSSVLDNGSLVFNQSDAVTFAAAISGSGGLTQTGMGLLTLLAGNTYTGGTTVAGGTLKLDFSQPARRPANIINNAGQYLFLGLGRRRPGDPRQPQHDQQPSCSTAWRSIRAASAIVLTASTSNPLALEPGQHQPQRRAARSISRCPAARNPPPTASPPPPRIRRPASSAAMPRSAGPIGQCSSGTAGNITAYSAYTARQSGHASFRRHPQRLAFRHAEHRHFRRVVQHAEPDRHRGRHDERFRRSLTLLGGGLIGNTSGAISGGTLSTARPAGN